MTVTVTVTAADQRHSRWRAKLLTGLTGQGGGVGGNPALRESVPRLGTCDWARVALVAGTTSLLGVAEHCTYSSRGSRSKEPA